MQINSPTTQALLSTCTPSSVCRSPPAPPPPPLPPCPPRPSPSVAGAAFPFPFPLARGYPSSGGGDGDGDGVQITNIGPVDPGVDGGVPPEAQLEPEEEEDEPPGEDGMVVRSTGMVGEG